MIIPFDPQDLAARVYLDLRALKGDLSASAAAQPHLLGGAVPASLDRVSEWEERQWVEIGVRSVRTFQYLGRVAGLGEAAVVECNATFATLGMRALQVAARGGCAIASAIHPCASQAGICDGAASCCNCAQIAPMQRGSRPSSSVPPLPSSRAGAVLLQTRQVVGTPSTGRPSTGPPAATPRQLPSRRCWRCVSRSQLSTPLTSSCCTMLHWPVAGPWRAPHSSLHAMGGRGSIRRGAQAGGAGQLQALDAGGATPLHVGARHSPSIEAFELLLQRSIEHHGEDVRLRPDGRGMLPLHHAAASNPAAEVRGLHRHHCRRRRFRCCWTGSFLVRVGAPCRRGCHGRGRCASCCWARRRRHSWARGIAGGGRRCTGRLAPTPRRQYCRCCFGEFGCDTAYKCLGDHVPGVWVFVD